MLPTVDPAKEVNKIEIFLQEVLKKTGFKKVVIGLSGGIDSSTALALAVSALGEKNVHVLLMPYKTHNTQGLQDAMDVIAFLQIPQTQVEIVSIDEAVDAIKRSLGVSEDDTVRLGNIMARVRMITLFDRAKKLPALVLGTENRSEYLLGYFTRFGDEASDIEPIQHLYKTRVYDLAKYLGLPPRIIKQAPTAGLWHGQTDEGELGFSYKEADQVLHLYFDKHISVTDIVKKGHMNAERIVQYALRNIYKHEAPYL